MKTKEEILGPLRGKGNFIHCVDYENALNAMEEYAESKLTDLLAVKQETEIELSKEEVIILEIWNYCCQYNVCCNAVHPSIIKTLAGKIKAYGEFVRDNVVVSEAGEQEKEDCVHNNTEFQMIRCNVCYDCGRIVETDV